MKRSSPRAELDTRIQSSSRVRARNVRRADYLTRGDVSWSADWATKTREIEAPAVQHQP